MASDGATSDAGGESRAASLLASLTGEEDGVNGEQVDATPKAEAEGSRNSEDASAATTAAGGGNAQTGSVASKTELFTADEEEEGDADLFGRVPRPKGGLEAGGLMGTGGGDGAGGLFADIDAEEERKERERRQAEEAARRKKEAEEAAARAAAEAAERERKALEQQKLEEEARQRELLMQQQQQQQQQQMQLQQQQQMQLQQQMQGMHLGEANPAMMNPQQSPHMAQGNMYQQHTMMGQAAQIPPQQQPPAPTDNFYRPRDPLAASNPLPGDSLAAQQQQQQQQQQTQSQPSVGYGASSMYYSTTGGAAISQTNQAPVGTVGDLSQAPTQGNQYGTMMQQPQQDQQEQQMQGRYAQMMQQPNAGFVGGQQPGMQQANPMTLQTQGAMQTARSNPSVLAGLHNGSDVRLGGIPGASVGGMNGSAMMGMAGQQQRFGTNSVLGKRMMGRGVVDGGGANALPPLGPPQPFQPHFGKVTVSDPLLVQASGLFGGAPHWTYAVTVRPPTPPPGQPQPPGGFVGVSVVRRRFRHFVALEDRMRESCPGAILPPRPDKHATRALEEASTTQSPQFAMQRATELEQYLNELVNHPVAGASATLRLFLTLQDHIGTAWPEVSSSTITRIGAVGSTTAVKVAEGTTNVLNELGADQQAAGEDNAELLGLAASEGLRMGSVIQAVPKIEGAVALIRDHSERSSVVGLELSKVVKEVQTMDRDLSLPLDLFSSALLRSGRRTKRLAVELSAAAAPFVYHHKSCRYERMAFGDRRAALAKRTAARSKADARAQKLTMHQNSLQSMGKIGMLERMEMEAAMTDETAVEACREADIIGGTLQREVIRISNRRSKELSASLKVFASSMREACAERTAIWESALEQFKTVIGDGTGPVPSPATLGVAGVGGGVAAAAMGAVPTVAPAGMGGVPPVDPSGMGGVPTVDPSGMGGVPTVNTAAMGGAPTVGMVGAPGYGAPGMMPPSQSPLGSQGGFAGMGMGMNSGAGMTPGMPTTSAAMMGGTAGVPSGMANPASSSTHSMG